MSYFIQLTIPDFKFALGSRIVINNFASETEIINNNEVQIVIDKLKKNNFIYKGKLKPPEGEIKSDLSDREQLLFKSTDFGDDKDRALQKSDNTWTYFAADAAYHYDKYKRNYTSI